MLVLRCLLTGGEVGSKVDRVRFTKIVIDIFVESHHFFKSGLWAFKADYKAETIYAMLVNLKALIKGQPEF